ncbi:MAG: hypothetical protein V7746_20645 [Halioglobus sp.]
MERVTYPSQKVTYALIILVLTLMAMGAATLLSIDDPVRQKQLISDSGLVQMIGQTSIALAFALCLFFAVTDTQRRSSYLPLSYLLMFYTLREADYHYKVSEYAKATQFKRFYSHEMIPLSTKLFMAAIVLLFLVVLYRYAMQEKEGFLLALKKRLPWAVFSLGWACVFVLSQLIDQLPVFHHTVEGPLFEEIFESGAEVIALIAVVLFRIQVHGEARGV